MATDSESAVLLFVAGDKSRVGKSSVCLGLLGSLLTAGFSPSDLAYIKPATQCEEDQLVARYCRSTGITAQPIGPIVFYSGFTRSFLDGSVGTSDDLLAKAKDAVTALASTHRIVIVDGVGYPAVGSICGVSNAHIANVLGAPVVLVGKRGVGDAVDSYNLNASFFESHDVRVLGGIFNRVPDDDSYYSLTKCETAVRSYFSQYRKDHTLYGYLPELAPQLSADSESASAGDGAGAGASVGAETGDESAGASATLNPADTSFASRIIEAVSTRIDVIKLLADAAAAAGVDPPIPATTAIAATTTATATATATASPSPLSSATESPDGSSSPSRSFPATLSREAVEAIAKAEGAACGS